MFCRLCSNLMYRINAGRWLALFKSLVETPQNHLFMQLYRVQLSFVQRLYIAIIILNLYVNQSINQSIMQSSLNKPKEGTVQRDNYKEHSRNMHMHTRKNTIKSTSIGYSFWSRREEKGRQGYRCLQYKPTKVSLLGVSWLLQ